MKILPPDRFMGKPCYSYGLRSLCLFIQTHSNFRSTNVDIMTFFLDEIKSQFQPVLHYNNQGTMVISLQPINLSWHAWNLASHGHRYTKSWIVLYMVTKENLRDTVLIAIFNTNSWNHIFRSKLPFGWLLCAKQISQMLISKMQIDITNNSVTNLVI